MRAARPFVPCLLSVTVALSCLPVEKGENPQLDGQTVRLTLLHTSDIHSRLLPYDLAPLKTDSDLGLAPEAPPYGGVGRLAALIRRERAASDRSLLLDSGDYFQGGPIFNSSDGEPEVRWVSMMGYDAVVMGNHEFDKGVQNFSDKVHRFASYPLLAANYKWENTEQPNSHGLDKVSGPYTIVNANGLRVGIIGMASIGSMYGIVDGGNSLQCVPLEQNETTRAYVEMLSPVVDMVVILSHLGLTEDQDLLTGYDAYYPYENAKQFINRKKNPWIQLEPAEPGKTLPDGTVRVFIPGVSNIDVILGGHLHVVLNPPQVIRDPDNRPVIISHPGAFSKYLGRLDVQVQMPPKPPEGVAADSAEMQAWSARKQLGAEIVTHEYRAFPVDGVWCDEEARSWRSKAQQGEEYKALIYKRPQGDCKQRFEDNLAARAPNLLEKCLANWDQDLRGYECDKYVPDDCLSRVERCARKEDPLTINLLSPYVSQLDQTFALARIYAFAPREIARRNSSAGGDAPLGNMTAESMRVRRRVEAEFALTNTLGMRDNLYPGPITLESMFNVFPFENTVNVMYLSGAEVQELTDYVAARSSERGCQAQAQVSGIRFVMDCAQAQKNQERHECKTDADCQGLGPVKHPDGWRCEDRTCTAHTSFDIVVNGKPLQNTASYKIAVNDYIAKGGSGFKVLKRNTTRIETNISMRDSLIDWLRGQCTCEEILGLDPGTAGKADDQKVSSAGFRCARNTDDEGRRIIDPIVMSWCARAKEFGDFYKTWKDNKDNAGKVMTEAPELFAGRCTCQDVLNNNEKACGHVNSELRNFCMAPTRTPIAIGEEDGRIGRRVK